MAQNVQEHFNNFLPNIRPPI